MIISSLNIKEGENISKRRRTSQKITSSKVEILFIQKSKVKDIDLAIINSVWRMGFCRLWMRWIKACIFTSHMSIMINGSPTLDFKVRRGLGQGDPFSPFLFVIIAEGLPGLVRKALERGDFKGFSVKEGVSVDMTQFAYDILLIGGGGWKNVQIIKAIHIGFELVSG